MVRAQAQLVRAHLEQLPAGAPAVQRQRGVGARGDHQAQPFRSVLDQELESLVDLRVGDEVEVVEAQEHLASRRAEGVQQRREEHRHGRCLRRGQRAFQGRAVATDALERRADEAEEALRVVVSFVERDPGDAGGISAHRGDQRAGLAEARRSAHERHRRAPGLREARRQRRACHVARVQRGRPQLRQRYGLGGRRTGGAVGHASTVLRRGRALGRGRGPGRRSAGAVDAR
ncbi:MAG: hypothetical protein EA416_07690 [Trueperaceae bacterium]|nr:MAG: hypothetical protein EA416_07690 [Trueperaceae bacterium]